MVCCVHNTVRANEKHRLGSFGKGNNQCSAVTVFPLPHPARMPRHLSPVHTTVLRVFAQCSGCAPDSSLSQILTPSCPRPHMATPAEPTSRNKVQGTGPCARALALRQAQALGQAQAQAQAPSAPSLICHSHHRRYHRQLPRPTPPTLIAHPLHRL
jgi:hypothetical protein